MPTPVTTAEQIYQLANEGKSVWVKNWNRSSPAAFLIGWQARMLINWIQQGQFTVYEKPVKSSKSLLSHGN